MAFVRVPRPRRRAATARSGVLNYEARRIARTVCGYGVLERRRLYELVDASKWRTASFDRACELAVQEGLVRYLGLGYYAAPRRSS